MKNAMKILFVLTFLVITYSGLILGQDAPSHHTVKQGVPEPQKLTEKQVDNLLLAIQDEVYDYGFEKKFYRVGITTGTGTGLTTEIAVYIRPYLDKGGGGEMIYKEMPYGEILRVFHFQSDGLAILDNDPELGFPITEPSHLTLFMDDDELCKDKRTWIRKTLEIADTPSVPRIVAGAERQQDRVGFSAYLTKHPPKK
jgi:hypothetical protein